MSSKREYSTADFHFGKSLLCFRPCKKDKATKDGECTDVSGARYGKDKCCVNKRTDFDKIAVMTEEGKSWSVENAGMVKYEELKRADGIKVF